EEGAPRGPDSRECEERDDHRVPLRNHGEREDAARRRFAETLERCAAPPAVIDAARPAEHVCEPFAVDPAGPAGMAGEVVLLRPLSLQERFGLAVTHLLFPERAHRATAMVPDHGPRAEPPRLAA